MVIMVVCNGGYGDGWCPLCNDFGLQVMDEAMVVVVAAAMELVEGGGKGRRMKRGGGGGGGGGKACRALQE